MRCAMIFGLIAFAACAAFAHLPSLAAKPADGIAAVQSPRVAQGYMDAEAFLSFLGEGGSAADAPAEQKRTATSLAETVAHGRWVAALVLILLGGLAMNLTPCVLPMIPINLAVIGKSATRGAWYGLGITVAYGMLGVLAAVGGLAFGEIQGNPWFNVGVALVFVILALALLDAFFIDFSRFRGKFKGGAFFMGLLSAVLAGACVAPVLIAVLLLTADLFTKGNRLALALPFVMGLGMALPWPLVGAGLHILPKPGGWMKRVNRLFAVVVLGFAVWYARLAWIGFTVSGADASHAANGAVTPKTFEQVFAKVPRPVLIDCWATWCKNCVAMNRTTLSDPRVQKALERFTVIRLQAEDMAELRTLPGFASVLGLPAFLIFE